MSARTLLHTFFNQTGIFLIVSFLVFRGTFVEDISISMNLSTGVNLILSFTLWGTINLHTYWLLPKYLFQCRYKTYTASISCLIAFMLLVMLWGSDVMGQHYTMPDNFRTVSPNFFFYLFLNTLGLILYFFAFSFTIFLRQWVSYHQRLNVLENNNIRAELNHLKKQLQPYFLSSMLNKARLFSKEEPGRASTLILKLSRLLRYQLYESTHEKVLVGDDIRFITDYLELVKLSDSNFNYTIRTDNEAHYLQIPPLLLMPIIEYSIQQSIDANSDLYKEVVINLRVENNMLHFSCSYFLNGERLRNDNPQQELPVFDQFRQRLEMIYPKNHELETRRDENELCVITLKIKT